MELNSYSADTETGFAFQNETHADPCPCFIYRVSAEELEGLGLSAGVEVSQQH